MSRRRPDNPVRTQHPGGGRGNYRHKTGPKKLYSETDLALFAEYREMRRRYAPPECDGGTRCWVEEGPPAFSVKPLSRCIGCGGEPGRRDR